jgi:hypothetical protein
MDPKGDVFIDDIFLAFLLRHLERGRKILPLVLHLFGRPLDTHEPLLREDILSLSKFKAEATPSERKIILGWLIDTRRLEIALPENKAAAWAQDILRLAASQTASSKALEQLVGRLNHVGYIIPSARHFLGRLRQAQRAATRRRGRIVKLTSEQLSDLDLWLRYLEQATKGINLNLITLRRPTHSLRSDACEHGIGGYNLESGKAWRWEIPVELRGRATLNALEFLASYVAIATEVAHNNVPPLSCFLSQTDSTTAAGWLQKSNFTDDDPLQLRIARATASTMMESESLLYSQWIPGNDNPIADCLSRDHDRSDAELTMLLFLHCSSQMPRHFAICPVDPELSLKMTLWLRALPRGEPTPKAPTRSKLLTGKSGSFTFTPLNSTTTPSSSSSSHLYESPSSPHSERLTEKTDSQYESSLPQKLTPLVPPSMLWQRALENTISKVRFMKPMDQNASKSDSS